MEVMRSRTSMSVGSVSVAGRQHRLLDVGEGIIGDAGRQGLAAGDPGRVAALSAGAAETASRAIEAPRTSLSKP
jgi:hypothetical protein